MPQASACVSCRPAQQLQRHFCTGYCTQKSTRWVYAIAWSCSGLNYFCVISIGLTHYRCVSLFAVFLYCTVLFTSFLSFISSSILQIILQHSRLQYIRFRFIKCTVTGKEAFNNFREKNRNAEMTILHHGSWLLCNYCLICDSEIEIVVVFFAA